ncbi:MAG: hypothetical protein ACFFCQ_02105 [Promethearchaeota archaeon]
MSTSKEGIQIRTIAIIAVIAIIGSYIIGYLLSVLLVSDNPGFFYGILLIIAFLMLLSMLLAMVGGIFYNFFQFVSVKEPEQVPVDT